MSKTVDELCDVFGQASGAEYERWLYDKRGDHVALAAGPALAMRRAGIAAVIRAVRDEICHGYAENSARDLANTFNEILGDAGEKVAAGVTDGNASPAAAPAPVCEWTRISEFDTVIHYSTPHGVMNDLHLWRGLQCSACHAPIKFTGAKT